MENFIRILIYFHAFFGGLGLLMGFFVIFLKKGTSRHVISGTLFSYSMIISSALSLIVSQMPNHENLLLFLIGIFTIYLVVSGNRMLFFSKGKKRVKFVDKLISIVMFIIAFGMLICFCYFLFSYPSRSWLYLFFGIIGLVLSLIDFKVFKNYKTDKTLGIQNHIGRMTGAFISSITAFIIAGWNIGNLIIWILPTVFGFMYIIYWNRKVKRKKLNFVFQRE